MGVWEQLDRRNQRIADYQNARAEGTPLRVWPDRSAFGWRFWALVIPMLVIGAILQALFGVWAKVAFLLVAATVCFTVVYVGMRRARERWEADRSST